ncbi:hypothetical protein [Gryllotalpicola koreensis]|uniref:Uncharacterized protein n=1 Tax=Gryllotalpicola koreensis TaxID=993086 RepID=A0ABP8A5M4_9MICO
MDYRWASAVVGLFIIAIGLLVLFKGQELSKFLYAGRLMIFGQRAAGKGQPVLARWWQITFSCMILAFGAWAIVSGFFPAR